MKTMLIYTEGEMIGDGIILLPFLVALKKALPHLRLTWMCERKTVYTGVLSELAAPLIDGIQLDTATTPKRVTITGTGLCATKTCSKAPALTMTSLRAR